MPVSACQKFLLPVLLVSLAGCWSITPPQNVKDPVPIYVADYGVHSSVLMPQSPQVYVEYSFGDWAYAVDNRETPWNATGALVCSFQSALGRTWTPKEPDELTPKTVRVPNRIYRIEVSRAKVDQAVAEMNARYAADDGKPVYNEENQCYFVRDSHHYSVLNSCNTLSAHLLEEMGCQVHGIVIFSNFSVKNQGSAATALPTQPATGPARTTGK